MNISPLTSIASSEPPVRGPLPTGAALRAASPDVQRAAVAAQFEAVLVRQLLDKTMTSMLGGAESGAAGSVYGDMLANTFAQQLTTGKGFGLARLLEQQLTPRSARPLPAAALVSPRNNGS